MKSFAVVSLLATAALAQNSSLIPSGISATCSAFLNTLDTNTELSSCANALVTATQTFAPGGSANASSSAVSTALNSICAANTTSACAATTIRSQLAAFQAACPTEVTSNQNVIKLYDVLYTLSPLQSSLCSKDVNGTYCPLSKSKNATVSSSSSSSNLALATLQQYLYQSLPLARRDNTTSGPLSINATTWASSNLAFLLIQPTESPAQLCTQCTREILTAYISYESLTPYAPGMSNSAILGGQQAIYTAIQSACGSDFLSGGTGNAGLSGGITTGSSSGALGLDVNGFFTAAAAAVMGMVVLL